MQKDISITVTPEEENNKTLIEKLIYKELEALGIRKNAHKINFVFVKKSIDARRGKLKLHLRYKIFIDEEIKDLSTDKIPVWKNTNLIPEDELKTVIIVGTGPAGLFAALALLEKGIRPVLIEQGEETEKRRKDIALISTKDSVNEFSNYCFGEGGAGTFSDGKLYTRSNKRGDISKILQIFAHFGSDPKILTDAHPHIGTEKLPVVINNIKNFIKEMGGVFYFHSKVCRILTENKTACGVAFKNVFTGEITELKGDSVILATGHSAYDIYQLMASISPDSLEAKTFAMGVRVEHPRALIDSIQYHGKTDGMGAAEYRLTTQVNERGVYSFCMCPGGFVVPSSSSADEIVVNGMSASGRNSKWSNAAIVVEIRSEDVPEQFKTEAEKLNCPALSGLLFRKWLECETKKHGDGQKAPSQILTDFLKGEKSDEIPKTSYTPGVVSSRLDEWLPEHISERLKTAFKNFDSNMHGFICKDAVLIASETRTSTPVRILRDKESLSSPALKNLYPCGEGSGYAGGIVSSAMDGEKIAFKITENLKVDL